MLVITDEAGWQRHRWGVSGFQQPHHRRPPVTQGSYPSLQTPLSIFQQAYAFPDTSPWPCSGPATTRKSTHAQQGKAERREKGESGVFEVRRVRESQRMRRRKGKSKSKTDACLGNLCDSAFQNACCLWIKTMEVAEKYAFFVSVFFVPFRPHSLRCVFQIK